MATFNNKRFGDNNLVRPQRLTIGLTLFLIVVASIDLWRSGSWLPMAVALSFAVVAFAVAKISKTSSRTATGLAVFWTVSVFLLDILPYFFYSESDMSSRSGRPFIFGTIAIIGMATLLYLSLATRWKNRRKD